MLVTMATEGTFHVFRRAQVASEQMEFTWISRDFELLTRKKSAATAILSWQPNQLVSSCKRRTLVVFRFEPAKLLDGDLAIEKTKMLVFESEYQGKYKPQYSALSLSLAQAWQRLESKAKLKLHIAVLRLLANRRTKAKLGAKAKHPSSHAYT